MRTLRENRSTSGFFILLVCCLVSLLAACAPQSGLLADQLATSKSASSVQTVQMPATETACPADGTARPAVMRPLALGKHPNIVYVYNEVPLNTSTANGILKRYDVITGQKTVLVTSGISIQQAQVSADGQWVLFLSTPDPRGDSKHSALLQLIRMDGQGLQTLYCLPAANNAGQTDVQWSTDQKSILIATDTGDTTSTVTLLKVATGKLQTELQISDQLYRYDLLTWLDTTRAYVLRSGRVGPQPPVVLYLLDITKNKDIHGGDLKKILEHAKRFTFLSLDSSYDARNLFVSSCLLVSNPFDTTISVGPATGGVQRTIYHQAQTICAQATRVVSATTLLMVVERYDPSSDTYRDQVWKMKPDGSGQTVLFDFGTSKTQTEYSVNVYTQFPWSNLSRDGSMYTLQTSDDTKLKTLLVGSLKGGAPTSFAYTYRGSVNIVGWTTM